MMTSSSTSTWRSPLSILMGARRNDDTDLELRDDYFRPSRPSPPAAAVPAPRTPAEENADQWTSSSRPSSYNPFSYFGMTSPARVLAAADVTPENNTRNNANVDGDRSPAPPLGAFPPPISTDSSGHDESAHGEEDVANEREEQDADHQFVSSHPWFKQVSLTEPSNHENNSPNDEPNDLPFISETIDRANKRFLTWEDQKAIIGTTFNFANSIIGAGAMGLGGAFAASGGGISIICLIGFAFLTKQSLDLVVDLSSCPSVIKKARSQDRYSERSDRENDIDGGSGSSFADSESSGEESESDGELSAMLVEIQKERKTSDEDDDVFDEFMEGYNNKGDEPDQGGSPENNEATKEDGEAEGESSQKALSPLMASPEEAQNKNDEIGDRFHTPTKKTGLGMDHPLKNLPGRLNERERYDSLAMDAAQPKYFSPLLPVVKSAPSIQIDTTLQRPQGKMSPCTYEELGRAAFGKTGRFSVLISKALYSLGCLIAYVVVVRDNFGFAFRRIIMGPTSPNFGEGGGGGWLYDDDILAFWVSAIFMLPLSCPRTMKPLAKFSFISIISISFLIIAVVYLFFTCTNPAGEVAKSTFYADWIQIRSFSGFIQSLGCFIFTFVCHHTVNLAYETLPPQIRNPRIWRRVSTNSIFLALQASLAIGVFAYLTFGSQTPADVLMGYPTDLTLANIARLLLCLTMVLTFPLPFLTCREMSILIFIDMHKIYHINRLERFNIFCPFLGCDTGASSVWARLHTGIQHQHIIRGVESSEAEEQEEFVQMYRPSFFKRWIFFGRGFGNRNVRLSETNEEWLDELNGDGGAVTDALLSGEEHEADLITSIGGQRGKEINPSPLSSRSGEESSSETTISSIQVPTPSWILPNGDGRQLSLLWHAALTFTIWLIVTLSAIKSPSLGDVLDLVGAFTGTLLAFVLPALFSFKLKGYSHLSLAILGIGGVVGLLGTIFSFVKFTKDTK